MERLPRRIDPSKLDRPKPPAARQSSAGQSNEEDESTGIQCRLDELLAKRNMTLTELSKLVHLSIVNLSVLKNNRAKAIRFSTLRAICTALDCTVGELLVIEPQD